MVPPTEDARQVQCENPAPVRSGKARLPRDGRVAPFHEIPDTAFAAEVILHITGALDDRFNDLSGPRRIALRRVVVPHRWPQRASAETTRTSNALSSAAFATQGHDSMDDRVPVTRRRRSDFTEKALKRHHLDLNHAKSR